MMTMIMIMKTMTTTKVAMMTKMKAMATMTMTTAMTRTMTRTMTTTMTMILHLWNDAVILKLLLQQSIFLLQCFHLIIMIIIFIIIFLMILRMRTIFEDVIENNDFCSPDLKDAHYRRRCPGGRRNGNNFIVCHRIVFEQDMNITFFVFAF